MDRRQFVVLGTSGLLGALAGCSGTTPTETPAGTGPTTSTPADTADPTRSQTSTPGDTAEPTATEATAPDQVVVVGSDGNRFDPESFAIAVGDTVKWVWEGGGHNVVPDGQPSGESWSGTPGGAGETYPSGYAYSHTFEPAGTYEYHCAPHRSIGTTGSSAVE